MTRRLQWHMDPCHKFPHVLVFHPVGSHLNLHRLDPDISLIECGYPAHMQLNTAEKRDRGRDIYHTIYTNHGSESLWLQLNVLEILYSVCIFYKLNYGYKGSRISYNLYLCWVPDKLWFDFWQKQKFFLFIKTSNCIQDPPILLFKGYQGWFLSDKVAGVWKTHWPPYSSEVRNAWDYMPSTSFVL